MNWSLVFTGFIGFCLGILFMTMSFFFEAHKQVEENPNITVSQWYGFDKVKGE